MLLESKVHTEHKLFCQRIVYATIHFRIVVLQQVALLYNERVGNSGVNAEVLYADRLSPLLWQCVAECDVLDLEERTVNI